jgi:hypothetical protein
VIWLSWRQQRLETIVTVGVLALAAAVLVPLGVNMASVYAHGGAAACAAHGGPSCSGIVGDFTSRFEHQTIVPWLNFLPGIFGVLFAAPLVLELEHRTFRLAWTQGVTRGRWLALKLVVIFGSGLVAAFLLTTLMTWWRQPLDHLQGRMEQNVFDFEGVVPYAYTFFAIALALAIGVVSRRIVASVAGTLLGYFVLRIGIQGWVRQHYLAPLRAVWPAGQAGPAHLDTAWILTEGPSNAHGHLLTSRPIVSACFNVQKRQVPDCLRAHHIYNLAVYQPASRFWIFQGIELGIFAGLGLLLLAAAVWWVRRRVS